MKVTSKRKEVNTQMNPIDNIYQTILEKTAIENHTDEKLVLLLERDPIKQKELLSDGAEATVETARIANVLLNDYQVVEKKNVISLDMAYKKSLENLLLDYKNWQEKIKTTEKNLPLEQLCYSELLNVTNEKFHLASRRMPDGTGFHLTEIYPFDWKKYLTSGFSRIDLVDSPLSLMQEYLKAYRKRERLVDVLLRYGKYVRQEECYIKLQNAKNELTEKYSCMGIFHDLDKVTEEIWELFLHYIVPQLPEQLPNNKKKLKSYMETADSIHRLYEKEIWNCLYNANSSESFLPHYIHEVKDAQKKLETIRDHIQLAIMKTAHETKWGYRLLPNDMDKTFTSVILQCKLDDFFQDSLLSWENPLHQTGAELLFATRTPLGIDIEILREHLELEMGFMLRRLEIKREWFVPELFQIIPELRPQNLWTYPISVVLIKDITLRFRFDETSAPYINKFYKQAMQNHGFLCFYELFCSRNSICTIDGMVLTCKMNWPIIAGYYVKEI